MNKWMIDFFVSSITYMMSAITFALCFHPSTPPSSPLPHYTHYPLSKIQYFFVFLKMKMDSTGIAEQIGERGESTLYNTQLCAAEPLQSSPSKPLLGSRMLVFPLSLLFPPQSLHLPILVPESWIFLTQNNLALPQLFQTYISSLITPFNRQKIPQILKFTFLRIQQREYKSPKF